MHQNTKAEWDSPKDASCPPSPFQPSSLTKRPTEKRHNDSCREEILVSNPVWLHGGLLHTVGWTNGGPGRSFAEPLSYYYARNAAGWRARRRFWREDCPFFFQFLLLYSFARFLFIRLIKVRPALILRLAADDDCHVFHLQESLRACSLGANLSRPYTTDQPTTRECRYRVRPCSVGESLRQGY